MQLIQLADASSFLKRSSHLLMQMESENGFLLSSAMTLAKYPNATGKHRELQFFIVERNGRCEISALHIPRRRLLLSTGDPACAFHLGSELATRKELCQRESIRAAHGPTVQALAFAEGLAQSAGSELRIHQKHWLMRLERAHLPSEGSGPGILRLAKQKDFKLLLAWWLEFARECGLDETPVETEESLRRYLEMNQLFIWEDKRAVAMAGYSGLTPNGARINMVYTNSEARGKGYAASAVAALSRKLFSSDGVRYCYLFVDEKNQPALRLYENVGYAKFSEALDLRA